MQLVQVKASASTFTSNDPLHMTSQQAGLEDAQSMLARAGKAQRTPAKTATCGRLVTSWALQGSLEPPRL
jgi:hypothetical protein